MPEKQTRKQDKRELYLNLLAQTYGIFAITFALAFLISYTATKHVQVVTVAGDLPFERSPYGFLVMFALASLMAYIFIKYIPTDQFWKYFFAVGAFAGLYITIYYGLIQFLHPTATMILAITAALGFLILRALKQWIWLHNLIIVISAAGVARLFGIQFEPKSTAIILAAIAIYDVIAVYYSKHMVSMASALFDRQAFFGVIIPKSMELWKLPLNKLKIGENISAMGAGDLAFPLIFALSNLFYNGYTAFYFVTAFVFVGVLVMHLFYVFPAGSKPIPALPPLVLFAFLGYFLYPFF
ncbi:MAG: presenilin family intramembrane aspartyl protease [Candidatus Kerfeldbacteria bacterium]